MDKFNEQYAVLAKRHGLPFMQSTALTVSSVVIDNADDVWQKIQAFNPQQGWLMFQSELLLFSEAHELSEKGVVLNAELASHHTSSLQVRQTPRGDWCLTTFTEGKGNQYLSEMRRVYSTEGLPNPSTLNYVIYWQDGADEVSAKYARFVGVGKNKIGEN